ncbi:hypothetical protein [Streptomyces drozdowiczii]|uniref:Uncharacterized protein n=1 Tax=Streptomyces drozdowiczii TaxID=202862 RepID=A0ABY6PPD3_9ACTN|nr:hypothetical protein [Streptomyces drozdowiczii]MCX0246453.1 hypothetical protein [Streptomyces drozdowiczii]UZK54045.1 hypothetical protein NEH16_07680 [Streptomyces drozdowiczii]
MPEPIVIYEELGPRVAAFTCNTNGRPTAVVNTLTRTQPRMRVQAAVAMLACGINAGHALGALHGVRS